MPKRPTNLATGSASIGSLIDLHKEAYETSQEFYQGKSKVEPEGWQTPDGHHFSRVEVDKTSYRNPLVKVNGVEAFSVAASLYKGTGRLGEISIDPKVDPTTGKAPPGKRVEFPYPTYTGPREQLGQTPYTGRTRQGKVPKIAPEANGIEDHQVYSGAIHTTWRDLREQLNTGMGLRTNKFLLEFSIPLHGATKPWKWNILCKSFTMPQRSMHTASMWRFGRKYNLRGETNFNDTVTFVFEDDSTMKLRRDFDKWFKEIDDSKLQNHGLDVYKDMGNPVARLQTKTVDLFEREDTEEFSFSGAFFDAKMTLLHPEYTAARPNYQTDIRVYQLDQVGNKVRGYLLQNAFISDIGAIEYGDDKQNELVTFPVTFTYSEFLPLEDSVLDEKIRVM